MRYSLRAIFVVMTISAVVSCYVGMAYRQAQYDKLPRFKFTRPDWLPESMQQLEKLMARERKSFLERAEKSGLPEVDLLKAEAKRQEKLVQDFATPIFDGSVHYFHSERPDWLPSSLDAWLGRRVRRFDLYRSVDSRLPAIINFPNVEEVYITSWDFSKGMMGPHGPIEDLNDLSPLADLRSLRKLLIEAKRIGDLKPLANLTNLEVLYLRGLDQPDLSPLSGLRNIRQLELIGDVRNVSALTWLDSLEHLVIFSPDLRDISGLSTLANLEHLKLSSNELQDISPLATCTSLRHVNLYSSPVSTVDVEKLRKQLPTCKIVYR